MTPFEWAQAERQKGIKEVPGPQANPRIVFYHSFTSLKATSDEVPWCSAFMCAAHAECGLPHTGSAAAVSWATFGEEGDGSQGDIAVFQRPGGHHVAFISEKYTNGHPHIICLGGNQGDQVRYAIFKAEHLVAIRRVHATSRAA